MRRLKRTPGYTRKVVRATRTHRCTGRRRRRHLYRRRCRRAVRRTPESRRRRREIAATRSRPAATRASTLPRPCGAELSRRRRLPCLVMRERPIGRHRAGVRTGPTARGASRRKHGRRPRAARRREIPSGSEVSRRCERRTKRAVSRSPRAGGGVRKCHRHHRNTLLPSNETLSRQQHGGFYFGGTNHR